MSGILGGERAEGMLAPSQIIGGGGGAAPLPPPPNIPLTFSFTSSYAYAKTSWANTLFRKKWPGVKRFLCTFNTKISIILSYEASIISIFHGCMVWIEKSVTRVTERHHEACRVMPNSDPEWQIFYPHHTLMIDTLSCIPFGLPHLIFNVELAIK